MPSAAEIFPEFKPFRPPNWMRPAMVQTILASQKFRKRGQCDMLQSSESLVLNCGDGVLLAGAMSRAPDSKGLMIFLHGWEGSQDSTYVISCARQLFAKGYSVFRLNFRDHGDTHALNKDVFHSVRLDEVTNGILRATDLVEDNRVFLTGFSLGGNFALRAARAMSRSGSVRLDHVFAISPVIDPYLASPTVDHNPLIKRYFLKKWRASLEKKEAAFPSIYDFSELKSMRSVMEMSDAFIPEYTPFETAGDYFKAYRVHPEDVEALDFPTSIIMSRDDPVVPASHLEKINENACVRKIMLEYGGHNGFFQSLTGPTWYDDYIMEVLETKRGIA